MAAGKRMQKKALEMSKVFGALGQPNRAEIYLLLLEAPSEIRYLSKDLGLVESLIVHHLNILKRAGWVKRKKEGKVVTYTASTEPLEVVNGFFGEKKHSS